MAQKIIITRPQADAEILAEEMSAAGFESVIEPMLIIESITIDLPTLSPFDGFVFTSANGVRSFSALSTVRDKPVFTVGEKTAYEAMQAGFDNVQSAGCDVSALAHYLEGKKGLYAHFRGQDVTQSLVDLLEGVETIEIKEFIVYQAVKESQISTKALKYMGNNEVSHVLFYSKRTAKTFVELLQNHECTSFVQGIKALCLADSMVECLSVLPWKEIQVAQHPDQESMLGLLKKNK